MGFPPGSLTILGINQNAVIMDVNVLECDKDDSTLFQIIDEVQFFEYPHCEGVGYSNFNVLPGDTIIAKCQFRIKQGTQTNPITLRNFIGLTYVYKQTDVEFVELDSININTDTFQPNCDNVQEIYYWEDKNYILPSQDCRNRVSLIRKPTLDTAGYVAYEFTYPYKIRWEEWRQPQTNSTARNLIGLGAVAWRCFPTPTQNWSIYANTPGWTPAFVIKAEVYDSSTEHTTEFEHISWGTIKDPCDIPYAIEFNTFDVTGLNSYDDVIMKDVDTKVVATITGDFSGYAESQMYGILTLDAWGVGGVNYALELGTHVPTDGDNSAWYGSGGTFVSTLTKVSANTVTLTGYLDYRYLPTDTDQFILSARIGDYRSSSSSSGATCMNEILIYAFTCGNLEIISVTNANTIVVRGEVTTQELSGVFVEDMILTFITATTWSVSGGTINGYNISTGSVGGLIIKAPTHPYTDAIVSDTIQGELTGTIYASSTSITGIGDMQIGCSFFIS